MNNRGCWNTSCTASGTIPQLSNCPISFSIIGLKYLFRFHFVFDLTTFCSAIQEEVEEEIFKKFEKSLDMHFLLLYFKSNFIIWNYMV